MNVGQTLALVGRLAATIMTAALLSGCALFPGWAPENPIIGTWANTDNDRVTFNADSVVVTPNNGKPTAMGPGDCNGVFKISYGRMATAPFATLFPTQADLEDKLKDLLVKPEYPVADVTCDRGGTTYFMVGDRELLAIYRDAGVGGLEHLSRL
ncbi:MAG TPA: hypothetical protein VN808_03615 [Stellaceae bacterium]|nr:hypothetical protein [Stellaceae bacterium]